MSFLKTYNGIIGAPRSTALAQTTVTATNWYTVASITGTGYVYAIMGCCYETDTSSGIVKSSGDECDMRLTIDGGTTYTFSAIDLGPYALDDEQIAYIHDVTQNYSTRRIDFPAIRYNVSILFEISMSGGTKDYLYATLHYSTDD